MAAAMLLLERGETYTSIRAKTGLSPNTIAALKRKEAHYDQDLVDRLRKLEESKLTHALHLHLDSSMAPEKIEKISSLQNTIAAGILIEKRELLSGRATVRIGAEIPDLVLRERIEALERDLSVEVLAAEIVQSSQDSGDDDKSE